HGRHHLRGVQGHREFGNPPRSQTHRSACLPVHRHSEERDAQRGIAASERGPQSRLGPAQGADAVVTRRSDGTAALEDGQDKNESGLPRLDVERKGLGSGFTVQGSRFMRTRPFGRTGWQVSEVGYGMWGMGGWTGSDDDESRASLERAAALGCTFFDTAWAYGDGKSERLLGALAKRTGRDTLVIATKVPPKN